MSREETTAWLVRGLMQHGYTKEEAIRKVEAAWKYFEGRATPPTEGELVYQALRA